MSSSASSLSSVRPPALPLVIGLLFLGQLCGSFGFMTAPVVNPVAAPAMGVPVEAIGIYNAFMCIGAAIASLGFSGLPRRLGPIRSAQAGLGMAAIGTLALGIGSPVLAAISGFLIGGSFGVMMPASSAALGKAVPSARLSIAFSIVQTGVLAGIASTGAILPSIVVRFGWQSAVFFATAVLLAPILLMQLLRPALDADREPAHPVRSGSLFEPMKLVWRLPRLRQAGITALLLMALQTSIMTYMVSYLVIEMKFSLVLAGAIVTVAQVAAGVSRIGVGWAGDRAAKPYRIVAALASGSALFALVAGLSTADWPLFAVAGTVVILTVTSHAWNGIYFASVARHAPGGDIGIATAGTQVFNMIGSTLGPLAFGAVAIGGHFTNGFLLFSAIALGAALWLWMGERERAP